jgi:hypothetical protein
MINEANEKLDRSIRQSRIGYTRCDQCEAAMINGVFCHETGCPNSRKRFIDGEWVRVRECFECGCEVLGDAKCCADEPITDEDGLEPEYEEETDEDDCEPETK